MGWCSCCSGSCDTSSCRIHISSKVKWVGRVKTKTFGFSALQYCNSKSCLVYHNVISCFLHPSLGWKTHNVARRCGLSEILAERAYMFYLFGVVAVVDILLKDCHLDLFLCRHWYFIIFLLIFFVENHYHWHLQWFILYMSSCATTNKPRGDNVYAVLDLCEVVCGDILVWYTSVPLLHARIEKMLTLSIISFDGRVVSSVWLLTISIMESSKFGPKVDVEWDLI